MKRPLLLLIVALVSLFLLTTVYADITQFEVVGVLSNEVVYPDNDLADIIIPRLYCVYDARLDITGRQPLGSEQNIDIVLVSDVSGSMRQAGWSLQLSDGTIPEYTFQNVIVPRSGFSTDRTFEVPEGVNRLAVVMSWNGRPDYPGSEASELAMNVRRPDGTWISANTQTGLSNTYRSKVDPDDSVGRNNEFFSGLSTNPQVLYFEYPDAGEYLVRGYGWNLRPVNNRPPSIPIDFNVYYGSESEIMRGETFLSIDESKKASVSFVNNMQPSEHLALVTFQSTSTVVRELSSDQSILINDINSFGAGGGTRIDYGIVEGINAMSAARSDSKKVMIVMTDGQNDQSPNLVLTRANEARAQEISVFVVSLGNFVNLDLMRQVADTPEQFYYTPDGAGLEDIYTQIQILVREGEFPQPTINLGENNADYDFISLVELSNTISWVNDYCDDETKYDCKNLVEVLNYYLTLCNSNPGTEDCIIPFYIGNLAVEGEIVLDNLNIAIAEAYLGPIFTGGGHIGDYTCDLLVECEEGQTESCLYGYPADVVVTMQYTQSMRTECDFSYDGLFPSDCGNPNYITRGYARDIASEKFVHLFLDMSPGNRMGLVPVHATIAEGQVEYITSDKTPLLAYIEKGLGTPGNLCFSCVINYSANMLLSQGLPDSTKSILLMSDGFSNFCLKDKYGQTCQDGPSTRQANSREEAIAEACLVYNTYGIRINTVAYGDGADKDALFQIAQCADGKYIEATNLDELIAFYEEIARDVSGDCEGLCAFTNYPPEPPEPFCGDGNRFSTDPPRECDWGSTNVNVDALQEDERACMPDDDDTQCSVCTTECIYRYEYFGDEPPEPPEDPDDWYCGDGFEQPSIGEECDQGTDVNTWEPCTPSLPGTSCFICTLECKILKFDRPSANACLTFDSSSPVDLSIYISYLGGRQIDLAWTEISRSGINDYDITTNNVLVIFDMPGLSGQLVLQVEDDEGRTDLACLNFVRSTSSFGTTPDTFTRLQIAKGRLVSGYYEEELTGRVIEYGPYLITAQVWQK